ncbi:hypothetical protein TSMEX_010733 [Taenia solium]|eukprot:TsM_000543800 transcript=TsM_000543800 gene=TsM_000543800
MGGSASRNCTSFRHIVTTNARVASIELGKPSPTVFLPSLHQAVDGTTHLDCRDGGEDCSFTIELKEEQAMLGDMQEERVATGTEINDTVEEVKEENFGKECSSIYLNNTLKATESPHPQPRFTAFEIPVHTGPCAMLTPMKSRDSPSNDITEVESHRPIETASTVTYSHPRTHPVALSRRYTPHRGPLRKKSTSSPQRKTLCQKYPQIYRKARESVLPLITSSTPSTQINYSTSSFRSESRCSLRKLNALSEWRTNRLDEDTWIHYPNRVSAQATRRPKLPQNPSTRRLKPIDKSVIPTNPAAGDQAPFPSKPQKSASSMLPPLTRSEVSRVRPTCKRGKGRGEVGLGAPCNRNEGSSLPPPTSFSPRVENAVPFSTFTLQMEEDGNSEELMQRDRLIFRDSKSVGETSYFKQYSMDEIHDSTKH